MGNEVGHTKGPWLFDHDWHRLPTIFGADGKTKVAIIERADRDKPTPAQVLDARLIAAAPDHALICWAMCVGAGRWEPWGDGRGEFCINGIRHATKLDEFGAPEMTIAIRAAILTAKGAS